MRVLVSGSSGLIGQALVFLLRQNQVEVVPLVRRQGDRGIYWDPYEGILDAAKLEGFDAVVHLAGESVAGKRWSKAQKQLIYESRVLGTRLLSETLGGLKEKPKTFVSASAIGFYGNRPGEELTETASAGQGFLSQLACDWEAATKAAEQAGIATCQLRIGIVLATTGGALSRLLPLFKMGLGGPIGSGKQYMSWIALDDLIGAIRHILNCRFLSGPINATAPDPVTNAEFSRTLAKVLGRPAFLAVPPFALKAAMGQMADELLLSSASVKPKVLLSSGFQFEYPKLEGALQHILA